MKRMVLLLALAAIMAMAVVSSGAVPVLAQDMGMTCGWWWDWWYGWYWACY